MNQLQPKNIVPTEQRSINALEYLREALGYMAQLRGSLSSLQKAGFVLMPESRTLKIQAEIREKTINYQHIQRHAVPSIKLAGKWLENAGFKCNQQVRVIALDQLLIICPEESQKQYGKVRKIV
jgi:hypothetical protein